MEIKCQDCGEYYKDSYDQCPSCAAQAKDISSNIKAVPIKIGAIEKKCRHCAMMIPEDAKICPYCRKSQGTSTGVKILAGIFILIGLGMCQSITSIKETSRPVSSINNSVTTESGPVLEVQNWSWSEEHGYAIAEGAVKNISSQPLDNVLAIIQLFDNKRNFIKSDRALVEYRPILPGQTSPFKVMSSYNPEMKHASISFKSFSGGTLNWREKAK